VDSLARVIVIRHADTDGDSASTTALNGAGLARAQVLRHILAEARIEERRPRPWPMISVSHPLSLARTTSSPLFLTLPMPSAPCPRPRLP
jgi:hypothetical protein